MRFLLFALVLAGPLWAESGLPFEGLLKTLRRDAGLEIPRVDPALTASCRQRAEELAAAGELSHTENGMRQGVQAMAAGLPPGEYGEVLGTGSTEAAVWKAWLASPTHRAVLAEPGWTMWAVGTAVRGKVTVFVVRFWKP